MRALFFAAAALCAGCIDDLDPKQIITAARVVDVIAEPPEVRPGEPSRLSAVLAGAEGEATYRWSLCPVTDLGALGSGASASTGDCFTDGAALLPLSSDAEATLLVPESVIAQATEAARRFEGALPPGALETYLRDVGIALSVVLEVQVDGRTLRALKRVVVSLNPAPNRNPPPPRVRFGARWVSADPTRPGLCVAEDGAALSFGPGETVTLTPDPDERWAERYTVLTADGRFAVRDEQAYYSWYATGGSLNGLTRSPLRDNQWTLPGRVGSRSGHSLWILLRDGHGGSSGCRVDVSLAR
ncbi:MAG: hypothetical protein R3A48_02270 [Polyangiales bacterium]